MTEGRADRGADPEPGVLGPERLLAFSDGVVAIALTLLILPLAELVPEVVEPRGTGLTLLEDNLAPIGSFLLSFFVIGRFWAAHHQLFSRATTASRALVSWNLLWLLTIVVMPFPTEMVGAYNDDPFTLQFYVATLFLSSALLTVLTVIIGRTLGPAGRAALRDSSSGGTALVLLLILVLVLIVPEVSYYPLLALFGTGLVDRAVRPVAGRVLGAPPAR